MQAAGLRTARNTIATDFCRRAPRCDDFGLPLIIRPAFTLGGRGGGIVRTEAEFEAIVERGLAASPIGQVLIDESVLGWGEFELEVMRDGADNVVIVCSIENVDPMGVHTGDSVTVAPQQTLTDRLYQQPARPGDRGHPRGRGGDRRLQRPVRGQPRDRGDRRHRDEPARVALVGAGLEGDGLPDRQDRRAARGRLPARRDPQRHHAPARPPSFEPTIDYVVVKWPRFAFEKFPGVDEGLSTHMKSVGEVMAIGRTFQQAFAKAMRSRELDIDVTRRRRPAGAPRDPGRRPLRPDPRGVPPGRDRGGGPRPHRDRPLVPARAARAGARSRGAVRAASARSRRSTPAPPSSPPRRPTTTRPGSARRPTRSAAATSRA